MLFNSTYALISIRIILLLLLIIQLTRKLLWNEHRLFALRCLWLGIVSVVDISLTHQPIEQKELVVAGWCAAVAAVLTFFGLVARSRTRTRATSDSGDASSAGRWMVAGASVSASVESANGNVSSTTGHRFSFNRGAAWSCRRRAVRWAGLERFVGVLAHVQDAGNTG